MKGWYVANTDQSTQQDLIGIAGGANVYGFAGGDPVNYQDPFGLKVEMGGLDRSQQDRVRALIRSSSAFRRWFNAIDALPADQLTMTLGNATGDLVGRVQAAGDGFTFRGSRSGMILFSTDANWASQSEFESVVAHEFAHAAAGLRNGTPATCYDAKAGGRGPEDCAVTEQNTVHGQIGYRNRSSYEDTGPFKSSGSEEKKKP